MIVDLFLDPDTGRTRTGTLYAQFRDAIESGRLAQGDRLPPSRQVASDIGVSRHTVTTVYGRLAAEGYIEGRAGGGSFVTATSTRPPATAPPPVALTAVVTAEPWSSGSDVTSTPRFDLRSGTPDLGLFPLADWRRCVTGALQRPPVGYDDPAGSESLRRTLAHWVGVSRAVEATPDQVIVTSGAQHGIDLITRLLIRPGHTVAVEDPGYPPVARLFRAFGADVAPVAVDTDGIIVDQIPNRAKLIYTTPSHQSPTGVTMSLERRRALLAFADANDAAIIEDDYDSEYRYVDRPLEPLQRLDQNGRVIYVGTFSKTLTPSLRLGFVVMPHTLAGSAANLRALIDRQPPAVMQDALLEFIVGGHLRKHLKRTRRIYAERHQLVGEFTHRMATAGAFRESRPSSAGLHVAVMLSDGANETGLRKRAMTAGVRLGNYAECWLRAEPPPGLIIGFGGVSTSDLTEALTHLEVTVTGAAHVGR